MHFCFDQLTNDAWQASYTAIHEGWLLRFANGVTTRANSVLPLTAPSDLAQAIEAAEMFYRDRDQPSCFQLSNCTRPENLDAILADRGYEIVNPSVVLTSSIEEVVDTCRVDSSVNIEILDFPSGSWLDLWWSIDGRGGVREQETAVGILTGSAATYVTAGDPLQPYGVGRAVTLNDQVGIYCLAVNPALRGRDIGQTMIKSLLQQSQRTGARYSFLQVLEHNVDALRLYKRLGYSQTSRYHYRILR